jgi:hypothetical protein
MWPKFPAHLYLLQSVPTESLHLRQPGARVIIPTPRSIEQPISCMLTGAVVMPILAQTTPPDR